MKKMRIRIGKEGKVKLDVEGAVGPECGDFTKLFEEALGDVVQRELKPDHDQIKTTTHEQSHEGAS